jgi:hypothetical protein
MGVTVFITFERDFGETNAIHVDGKALATALNWLDGLAQRSSLPTLSSFIAGFSDVLDDDALSDELAGTAPGDGDADLWFLPEQGIKTVNGLLRHGKATPTPGFEAGLLADLEGLRAALKAAKAAGVRFRLELDI